MPQLYKSSEDFIYRNVDIEGECLVWSSKPHKSGYASITSKWSKGENYAHRLSYRVFIGDIPDGMHVCHTCDNPMCVNPNHLWPGDDHDNGVDAARKDRRGIKLNNEEVQEIRELLSTGVYSQDQIADTYNINQCNVSRINSKHRRQYV